MRRQSQHRLLFNLSGTRLLKSKRWLAVRKSNSFVARATLGAHTAAHTSSLNIHLLDLIASNMDHLRLQNL